MVSVCEILFGMNHTDVKLGPTKIQIFLKKKKACLRPADPLILEEDKNVSIPADCYSWVMSALFLALAKMNKTHTL